MTTFEPLDRVTIPTVEGDRIRTSYATVVGMDVDNDGHVLVSTARPVMGEHFHSIPVADVERVS